MVIEVRLSQKSGHDYNHRRRRLECKNCGQRVTTWEIPSEELKVLREHSVALKKITQAIKTFQDVPEPSIPCYTCIHNCREECSIGFLEFMSTDATGCSAYKKID